MTISSPSNPRAKQVRALQASRRARYQHGAFVVEGSRLLREALEADARVEWVFFTGGLGRREQALVRQLARRGAESFEVSDEVMRACSDTQTPPGLLAVVPIPDKSPPAAMDFALVIDGVRNPGNLGGLIRSALAAGVQATFLLPGSVDPFNPKVVRGAMGAHFHMPILALPWEQLSDRLRGLEIWVATAQRGRAYTSLDGRRPLAVVIGGEAGGPEHDWEHLGARNVHIPTHPRTESLNATIAGSVILFEIARQRGAP